MRQHLNIAEGSEEHIPLLPYPVVSKVRAVPAEPARKLLARLLIEKGDVLKRSTHNVRDLNTKDGFRR